MNTIACPFTGSWMEEVEYLAPPHLAHQGSFNEHY